jgi:hypothetical protein
LDPRIFPSASRAIQGCRSDLCFVRTTSSARVILRKSDRSIRAVGPLLQTRWGLAVESRRGDRRQSSASADCRPLVSLFTIEKMIRPVASQVQTPSARDHSTVRAPARRGLPRLPSLPADRRLILALQSPSEPDSCRQITGSDKAGCLPAPAFLVISRTGTSLGR